MLVTDGGDNGPTGVDSEPLTEGDGTCKSQWWGLARPFTLGLLRFVLSATATATVTEGGGEGDGEGSSESFNGEHVAITALSLYVHAMVAFSLHPSLSLSNDKLGFAIGVGQCLTTVATNEMTGNLLAAVGPCTQLIVGADRKNERGTRGIVIISPVRNNSSR